jgi:uncharacterized damage-inducible protein DinB
MDAKTIRFMWDYTRWADARMFEAVSKVTSDQYVKDLGSSHKSLRDTMVHLVSAQWIWLSRWKGTSPQAMWASGDYPTFSSLRDRWTALHAEIEAFLSAQADPAFAREVVYQNLKGDTLKVPLGPLCLHVANHSSYHRGQVTTLLRQLGAQPISTDLALFVTSR